jgi:hypothetical protein
MILMPDFEILESSTFRSDARGSSPYKELMFILLPKSFQRRQAGEEQFPVASKRKETS